MQRDAKFGEWSASPTHRLTEPSRAQIRGMGRLPNSVPGCKSAMRLGVVVSLFLGAVACSREAPSFRLRPLSSAFKRKGTITLRGIRPESALAFATDTHEFIYVVDEQSEAVKQFTLNGSLRRQIGARGVGPGRFVGAWAVACDQRGLVYVLCLER
jgi:hypothetical protein